MSTHRSLTVAAMHGVLVYRPGSPVFHVALRDDLTPSGRRIRRAARTVCAARTRQPIVIPRTGVRVDLGGRRMCARCSARLDALARRTEQPPTTLNARKEFWEASGIETVDLVVALATASTVDETYAIGSVANTLRGRLNISTISRPSEPGPAQGRWDFEQLLIQRRNQLRYAELTPEALDAAAAKRETEAMRDEQIRLARRKEDAIGRALDRRNRGGYTTRYDRDLLNSA